MGDSPLEETHDYVAFTGVKHVLSDLTTGEAWFL